MATISAVETFPGQRTDNGENGGKTADQKPSSPEFKRNYFITNPESRPPTEGAKNPDRPDQFTFEGDTREQMRTFLDNFMAENYNARWDRGGEDLLKERPAAEALFKLLGGEKSGGLDDNALQAKINSVLKTPEGWVLTKSLVEEDTAIKMMTLGLLAATENPDRTTNPQDIIDKERKDLADQSGTSRVKHLIRRAGQTRLGRHPQRTGAAIGAGVGILGQSVDAIPDRISNFTDFLGAHPDLIDNLQTFGSRITPDGTLTTAATTLAGLGLGWYAGRRRNTTETALNKAHADAGGLLPAAEALNVIQNDDALANYVKRTMKIDVSGLQVDPETGRIEVIDQTKITGDIKGIMEHAKTALVVRSLYYRDLGVPPADRTIMPERSFLNNGTIQGGSPEILEQKIQARFRELGDTVDRWGNPRYLADGVTENPLFNRRAESETPQLDAFISDINDNTVDNPWYHYETNPLLPDDPEFKLSEVRHKTSKAKNRYKVKGFGVTREIEVVEHVNDKWGQVEYLPPSGIKNPFWGKVDASAPPYSFTPDQIANLGRKPDNAFIEHQIEIHGWPPNTEDKWGQKPEDPGFGRENLTKRHKSGKEIGQKKAPDFDTQKIRPRADALDRYGRGNTSIWWGTDKDMAALHEGRGLPDYNIQAIVDAANPDSLDIWGQEKRKTDGTPNPFYGRIDAKLAENNARLADANMNLVPVTTDTKGVARDIWGQTAVYTSGPLKGKENPYFRRIPESFVGTVYTSNFNENDLVDQFNQKRLNPDGTQNIFFTRLEEAKLKPLNLDNIEDIYKYDQYNQPLIITEGARKGQLNILFGRNGGIALMDTLDSLGTQLTHFRPEDLTDLQDRDFRDPLFASGEHYTRNRAGKKVKITTPARIIPLVEDAAGNKPTDAAFWTGDPVPTGGFTPDYGRYNPHTGKDADGRLPSHPLFCIDAAFRQPDITTLQVDKWGQRRGTTEAFGIRGPDEQNDLSVEANIAKFMKARADIMADLARDVLVKIDKKPAGDGALLNQKLNERKNGTKVPEKKEKALKKKTELEEDKKILEAKLAAVDAYKESSEKLKEAQDDLKKYLREAFGDDSETEALRELNRILSGRDEAAETPSQITIDGIDHDFDKSIPKQKEEIAKEFSARRSQISADNPKESEESAAEWRTRLQPLYDGALDEYNEKLDEIKIQQQLLYSVRGEIETHQLEIKKLEKTQRLDSDERKKLNEALDTTDDDVVTQINEIQPFVERFIRDIDRVTIDGLLQVVNQRYENTKNTSTPEGWPENENNTHREAVVYSLVNIKIATLTSGTLATDISIAREEYMRGLLTRTQREITRTDREANAVEDEDDIRALEVTIDLMNRQGEIFDKTREVLANAKSVFKVLTEDRTGSPIPEQAASIQNLKTDNVKDDAKERYTPAELNTPDSTPLSYLEMLQMLTGYQDRADRNDYYEKISVVIRPEILVQAFLASAIPPLNRNDDDLTKINMSMNKNIGAVTALQMHNVLLNVLDTLKARGLALP